MLGFGVKVAIRLFSAEISVRVRIEVAGWMATVTVKKNVLFMFRCFFFCFFFFEGGGRSFSDTPAL